MLANNTQKMPIKTVTIMNYVKILLSIFFSFYSLLCLGAEKPTNQWVAKHIPLAPFYMTYLEDISQPTIKELVEKKQYGPELAQKLDIQYLWDGYKYDKQGVYRRDGGGVFIHSISRHLCEEGVSEEEAEKKHEEMQPPSFVGRDGIRYYAMMH